MFNGNHTGRNGYLINTFNEIDGMAMSYRIALMLIEYDRIKNDDVLVITDLDDTMLFRDRIEKWSDDLNNGQNANRLFVFKNTYRSYTDFKNISDEILNIIMEGPFYDVKIVFVNIVDRENVPIIDFSNAVDLEGFNIIDA